MEKINIAFNIDNGFVKFAKTTLNSILNNTKSEIRLFVLHFGTLKGDEFKEYKNVEISYIKLEMTKEFEETLNVKSDRNSNGSLYGRLFLSTLKETKNIDKIIYLDVDLVFGSDIKELWDIDIKDNLVAGVRDYYWRWNSMIPFKNNWNYYKNFKEKKYINTGVVIHNLKEQRKTNFFDKIISFITDEDNWSKNKEKRRICFYDQDATNYVSIGRIHYLPKKWNIQANNTFNRFFIFTKPGVVHFNSGLKPWKNKLSTRIFNGRKRMNLWKKHES